MRQQADLWQWGRHWHLPHTGWQHPSSGPLHQSQSWWGRSLADKTPSDACSSGLCHMFGSLHSTCICQTQLSGTQLCPQQVTTDNAATGIKLKQSCLLSTVEDMSAELISKYHYSTKHSTHWERLHWQPRGSTSSSKANSQTSPTSIPVAFWMASSLATQAANMTRPKAHRRKACPGYSANFGACQYTFVQHDRYVPASLKRLRNFSSLGRSS